MLKKHKLIKDLHRRNYDSFRRAFRKAESHVEKIQIAEDFLEDVVDMMNDYIYLANEYKELRDAIDGVLEDHK